MLRRIFTLLIVILLAALLVTPAAAQDYDFSMDRVDLDVYWNEDGTLSLDYLLTYTNQPGGHIIDFVDVGLPTNTFDLNSVRADFDGNPLGISSDFQGPSGYGIAVEMGPYAIQSGETGTIHVQADNIPVPYHANQILHPNLQEGPARDTDPPWLRMNRGDSANPRSAAPGSLRISRFADRPDHKTVEGGRLTDHEHTRADEYITLQQTTVPG